MLLSTFWLFLNHHQIDQIAKIEKSYRNRPHKYIKEDKVLFADAFRQPRAVVIIVLDAYITISAVIDSFGNEHFAYVAVTTSLHTYVLLD